MLKFKLTDDKRYFQLIHNDLKKEVIDLKNFFKKRAKGYHFSPLFQRRLWDGYDKFINKDNQIGVGLWYQIKQFSQIYGHEVELDGLDSLLNLEFTKDQLEKFASVLLDGVDLTPYDYQMEAAYRALKFKFSAQELATSAGKTLILFLYLSFLKRKGIIANRGKKALIVVPNISLVGQTAEKFVKDYHTGLINWNILEIGGKNKYSDKKFEEADLVISTYQSLAKRDGDFFKKFTVICIDECHTSRGDTIKDILLASTNVEYKLGLSGTIQVDEDFSDFYKIQEYIGPLSMTLKSSFLIENKHSPDVFIKMLFLKYPETEPFIQNYKYMQENGKSQFHRIEDYGKNMFQMEKDFIISYEPRVDFISNLAKKLGGNSLILYINVKDKYGQRIKERISEWNPNSFYIDGEVSGDHRAEYKDAMEAGSNVALVASYATFATGIDLKNVQNIIFAESYKSEITIRQAVGRGMRKLAGKHKVTIYDLIDDLNGYIVKHGKVREKIYEKEQWIVSKHNYDLTKLSTSN